MFGYALRHPKLPASNGIVNKSGLTPLTLACKLGECIIVPPVAAVFRIHSFSLCTGRAEVFREMLELSAKEFWRYSNITCSAYPLNALDTLLPSGKTSMFGQQQQLYLFPQSLHKQIMCHVQIDE